MTIIHKIEDFIFQLFPKAKQANNDLRVLRDELEEYYTYGVHKPKVTIESGWAKIEIDTATIANQEMDYRKAVNLCEKGQFEEAKLILQKLISANPANSEYHRILGQLLSEQGDQEEAINCIIDALRWDPKNGWALLMMGNIFAKYKNDLETAMVYYDQAVKVNPNDNIAVNNIGGNLMQQGRPNEAKKYFREALKINNDYPNTHYALALVAEMEGDLSSALYSANQALKKNNKRDGLYQTCLQLALKVSGILSSNRSGQKIIEEYKGQLEKQGGTKIIVEASEDLPTAAKMELAENYGREYHLVRYKPNYPAVEHLVMHELVHVQLIIEARKINENKLFVSTQNEKRLFIKSIESDLKKLQRMGISESSLAKYSSDLFDGINRQIFNTPIDLFIEDMLYEEFPELRPFQLLSLYNLNKEALHAVTDKKIVELSPRNILSRSKVFNIISAMHFVELFGVNMLADYKATQSETNEAKTLYKEFEEYRNDREPGEEYELVAHWAKDMRLDQYFELIDENEFRKKRTNIDAIIRDIEEDPYGVNTKDPAKDRDMATFQKSQTEIGTNMAVAMFMVDALQYFENVPKSRIKEIAFEIARLGTQGIRPDHKDYSLHLVPGKTFSGYHLLAYYYVSWKLAIPEMVDKLQLPYDQEYDLAINMHKPHSHE